MDKADDLKDLGVKIKVEAEAEGLALAEEAIEKLGKAAYLGLKEWLIESANLSPNPADDIAVKFICYVDQLIMPQIEKIDLDGDGK